jgi:hypothetical protein
VFLRTSKAGGRRTILTALKLTRWETVLAVALYVAVGLLADLRHRPWLLIFLIFLQATVYLCGPIVSVWNLRAQGVQGQERRRAFAERRLRAQRRRRVRALLPRPAAAALTAVCVGGVTSAFIAPAALLHATTVTRPAVTAQSLLASAGTEVYLKLGSSTTGAGRAYYPITSAHLSDLALSFDTSSLVLLGQVLRAAADEGGRITQVSLAFRTPGPDGRPTTELVDRFSTAVVTSFTGHLSGTPAGTVALTLPAASDTSSTPGPFAPLAGQSVAKASVNTGTGPSTYAVTAVTLSQAARGTPLDFSLTTSALPLLQSIFRTQGAAIPVLTLTVRAGAGGSVLWHTFSGLSVSSFSENLSGSLSGTATLVSPG